MDYVLIAIIVFLSSFTANIIASKYTVTGEQVDLNPIKAINKTRLKKKIEEGRVAEVESHQKWLYPQPKGEDDRES